MSSSTAPTHAGDSRLQALGGAISGQPNSDSGFSASQLSPMEHRYGPIEVSTVSPAIANATSSAPGLSGINAPSSATGLVNGYGAAGTMDPRNSMTSSQPAQLQHHSGGTSGRHAMTSAPMDVNRSGIGSHHHNALHYGKQLPQIGGGFCRRTPV